MLYCFQLPKLKSMFIIFRVFSKFIVKDNTQLFSTNDLRTD